MPHRVSLRNMFKVRARCKGLQHLGPYHEGWPQPGWRPERPGEVANTAGELPALWSHTPDILGCSMACFLRFGFWVPNILPLTRKAHTCLFRYHSTA